MLGQGVCVNLATLLLLLLQRFGLNASFLNESVKSSVTSVTFNDTELFLTVSPRIDRRHKTIALERARTPAVEETKQKVSDEKNTGHITKPGG